MKNKEAAMYGNFGITRLLQCNFPKKVCKICREEYGGPDKIFTLELNRSIKFPFCSKCQRLGPGDLLTATCEENPNIEKKMIEKILTQAFESYAGSPS